MNTCIQPEPFDQTFLDAFQVEDIARLCMKGGGVLSWQQGMGKTIGAMLYGKAVRARTALFVVPQDIVPQWMRAAEEKFLTDLRPIAGVREAIRVRERLRAGHTGWYITWFEAISQAGKIEKMSHIDWLAENDAKGRTEYQPRVPSGPRRYASLTSCPRCGMTSSPDRQPTGQQMRDFILKHGHKTTEDLLETPRREWPKGTRRSVAWHYRSRPRVGRGAPLSEPTARNHAIMKLEKGLVRKSRRFSFPTSIAKDRLRPWTSHSLLFLEPSDPD